MTGPRSVAGTSILITDVDRRKALPIVRSLGSAGVRVIGLSHAGWPVAGLSRYCAETLRCPDYRQAPEAFCTFLRQTCEQLRPDVFLPLEDGLIELCLSKPECWQPHTRALLPDAAVMDVAGDKWKTLEVARRVQVPIPDSHCPGSAAEVDALAGTWRGGAVIKPRKTNGSRGMVLVQDASQIPAAWARVNHEFPRPVIQQRVPATGAGLGVSVIMDAGGELLALFGHKRLREYPISGGPSTMRVSHRDETLIDHSLRLLRAMNFRGVAMVEFKFDPTRGEAVLMEVNPRFWGSIGLAVAAGVDFPLLYHMAAAGMDPTPVLEYRTGVYGRWLLPGDLMHFIQSPQRMHLNPSFFRFRAPDLHYDIISLRDPLPMAGIIVESLRRITGMTT